MYTKHIKQNNKLWKFQQVAHWTKEQKGIKVNGRKVKGCKSVRKRKLKGTGAQGRNGVRVKCCKVEE